MKFQQLCTRCQTANRLVSTREKEDFEGNTCVLGNFCHQFDLVNSTQPPWWPKKQKAQAKRHRNFSQDFPSNFQSVTFKCKGGNEPCSVNSIYLVALIKVSETFYVRVYRGYISLVISLGNQRVVVSHKMSLKLTKINLWDLNEIKAFFSWTESLWKFEENFNKCLSQNPT